MLANLLALVGGLALLIYGAERTVAAATTLARAAGVSVFFIGATLVATGSSLPEIATSIYAGLYQAGDLAVGHIVGSATSQITLGLGLLGLVYGLTATRRQIRTYGGGMLVAMTLMIVSLRSGGVSHLEGALLALAYLAFLAFGYEHDHFEGEIDRRAERMESARKAILWFVAGLVLVIVGGHLLVTGGKGLARELAVSRHLVGLITGLGTTLPEIVIALLAVRRDRSGIAVGTLVGSNITDPLFSLGIGAAIGEFALTDPRAALLSALYMLGVSIPIIGVFYVRRTVDRPMGAVCVLLYLGSFAVV